ncbi:carboxymuconolactone decarboxylase family protein [Emcibacter sp.]|uniref:carboxymuconolactone decarboxylase family protein n=1 Tax=Emcibacter sp. TaxID=1979954 RepID=UPI002AA7DDF2|nr:carboxymuconolactone decarboxylase family protein [Emcibacter sp.]
MTQTPLGKVSIDELPEGLRPAWETLNGLTGDATFVEVFAQAPELLKFVMGDFYQEIFFGGRVENKYKQLVRLRLSLSHGCRTCNLQNVPGSLEAGVTREQIDHLEDYENGPFSEKEKAVLGFADQMALTNLDGVMDQQLYDRLHSHFSDAEICELGTVMAVIGGMAKLSFVMNLVEKEDSCPFARAV